MRYRALILFSFLVLPIGCGQFPMHIPPPTKQQIKNVIVIVQENRTPDNLFHYLSPACPLPTNADVLHSCIPANVSNSCYDISPCGVSNQSGAPQAVTLTPSTLGGFDPLHTHTAFMEMCDPDPVTFICRNDGAWQTSAPTGNSYAYVENSPVTNSDGSPGSLLDPYLALAEQYGWANFMYQTNQGGSYAAHQFIFSGTSAMTAADDAESTFVSENFSSNYTGCLAPQNATTYIISPSLEGAPAADCMLFDNGSVQECPIANSALVYPGDPVGTFCYPHQSMADLLDPKGITWKYYATSASAAFDLWIAPNSFQSICQPAFVDPSGNPNSALQCTGQEYNQNVDLNNRGTDILRDITSCSLSQVSWVTPDGLWSDHAGEDLAYGPSWVATIVNLIGNNPQCAQGTPDAGQTYWLDTAIVVMWDDWGGWSDNQPPPYASYLPCTSIDCQGDYQYGFRVPLIVVSAYTPAGYIDNTPYDFGSVLRFIESTYHIPEGALGFADQRSPTDLRGFFTLPTPRNYSTIPVEKDASFFLGVTGQSIEPDDD